MKEIKFKREIIKIVEIYLSEAKIYLFGSYARGDNQWGSDIDIALDVGRKITLKELRDIQRLISALPMAQKVDVVCMHRIPEKMKENILREGIVWKS